MITSLSYDFFQFGPNENIHAGNPWKKPIFSYISQRISSNESIFGIKLLINAKNLFRKQNLIKILQFISYGYHIS